MGQISVDNFKIKGRLLSALKKTFARSKMDRESQGEAKDFFQFTLRLEA